MSCVGILMPAMVAAQTAGVTRSEVTLRGTVEAVDHSARTVTIKGSEGTLVTLDVPPAATRFEQVKVGDIVTIVYYDRVSVRLKPPGEPASDRVMPPTTTATPGALPGAPRAPARGDGNHHRVGPDYSPGDLHRAQG